MSSKTGAKIVPRQFLPRGNQMSHWALWVRDMDVRAFGSWMSAPKRLFFQLNLRRADTQTPTCHSVFSTSTATRAVIYRSLRAIRARNRKKGSRKVFWRVRKKSPKKKPKKSVPKIGIFRLFRVFLGTFLRTPQKRPFLRLFCDCPETPVNGEKLNWGVSKPGCFPLFSGKVQIVSRTLSGLFLVGALNRPRKRKKTNRERKSPDHPRANRENPRKIGKVPKRTKKGQKRKGKSRSGNPPV